MVTLDLTMLRNFAAIARSGSISITSHQVGRTQSALSMQMRRLEQQVGATLLHRGGTGVRLTASGEKLLAHAESLLAHHDDFMQEMSGSGLSGTVTLGCPEDYSIAFLPTLLRDFFANHPNVELRLVCAPTTELRPLLNRRQIDLALVSVADPDGADVIRRENFVWVVNAPDSALVKQRVLPLALSAPMTIDYRAACDAMDAIGRRYRVAFASDSLAGLVALARSGHAISVMTRTAMPPDLFDITGIMPHLPQIGIVVEYADRKPSPAVGTLGTHIQTGLARM